MSEHAPFDYDAAKAAAYEKMVDELRFGFGSDPGPLNIPGAIDVRSWESTDHPMVATPMDDQRREAEGL